MRSVSISRNSTFPLRTLHVSLGEQCIKLRGRTSAIVNIPNDGTQLQMKMDWWKRTEQIPATTSTITLTHVLPDWFYVIGLVFVIAFSIATALSIIAPVFLCICVLIFVAIIAGALFLSPYFRVKQ